MDLGEIEDAQQVEQIAFRALMEVRDPIREPRTAEVEGAVALAAGVVNQGTQQGPQGAHWHHHSCGAVAPLELLEVVEGGRVMPVNQEAFVRLVEPDPAHPTFATAKLGNVQEQVPKPLGGFVAHNRRIKVIAQQGSEGLTGTFRWSRNEKRAL